MVLQNNEFIFIEQNWKYAEQAQDDKSTLAEQEIFGVYFGTVTDFSSLCIQVVEEVYCSVTITTRKKLYINWRETPAKKAEIIQLTDVTWT